MLFENNDNYLGMLLSQNDTKLYSYDEGFNKGNMFSYEYVPYKNYEVTGFKAKNEKEAKLLKIMMLCFAINDFNLYLDLHPENKEVFKKYKEAVSMVEKLKDEYQKTYGPLTVFYDKYDEFKWMKTNWPWEGDDSKYV